MRASSVTDCFPRMCQAQALIHSNERKRKRVREREVGWKEEEEGKQGGKKGRIWMAIEKHADPVPYLET